MAESMMADLHVAGNYEELYNTRQLLANPSQDWDQTPMTKMERGKLEAKIRMIASRLLLQKPHLNGPGFDPLSTLNNATGTLHAKKNDNVNDHYELWMMEQAILKALRGLERTDNPELSLSIVLPQQPAIESMSSWTPSELRLFLETISGDFADKARFKDYAALLEEKEVDGSCMSCFERGWLGACGVPIGDQEALHRGIIIVARLHEASLSSHYQFLVTVNKASHLPKMDVGSLSDPYVILKLDDNKFGTSQEYCTTYKTDTLDAEWNYQVFDFSVRDLNAPGELVVRVLDHDRILQDKDIGAYMFGEIFASVPQLGQIRAKMATPYYLSDILQQASRSQETLELPLFFDGIPVIGEDMKASSVTVSFKVAHGGHKQIHLTVMGNDYPRSCLQDTTRLTLRASLVSATLRNARCAPEPANVCASACKRENMS